MRGNIRVIWEIKHQNSSPFSHYPFLTFTLKCKSLFLTKKLERLPNVKWNAQNLAFPYSLIVQLWKDLFSRLLFKNSFEEFQADVELERMVSWSPNSVSSLSFSAYSFLSSLVCAESLSPVWLFATLWTAAHQAPLSTGVSRQEYWSGLPCPPPGDLPKPGIEPRSPALQVDSLPSEPPGKPILLHL